MLTDYKSSPDDHLRLCLTEQLAELVAWFLSRHGPCIARQAGGGWDRLDVVPSTRRPGPVHPLALALDNTPALAGRRAALLRRGTAPLDHLVPDPAGYKAAATTARVLLLDDLFTTGARARSAAAALTRSGATVVAIVPLARIVHIEDERAARWWRGLSTTTAGGACRAASS